MGAGARRNARILFTLRRIARGPGSPRGRAPAGIERVLRTLHGRAGAGIERVLRSLRRRAARGALRGRDACAVATV